MDVDKFRAQNNHHKNRTRIACCHFIPTLFVHVLRAYGTGVTSSTTETTWLQNPIFSNSLLFNAHLYSSAQLLDRTEKSFIFLHLRMCYWSITISWFWKTFLEQMGFLLFWSICRMKHTNILISYDFFFFLLDWFIQFARNDAIKFELVCTNRNYLAPSCLFHH